jgi:hypothetical protein
MSKIGVGIGEDFPADDSKPQDTPRDRYRCGPRYMRDADDAARREAYRKWREQRREWKRQWKSEWRARKRAFRAQVGESLYEGGHPGERPSFYRGPRVVWAVLGLIGAIALISFAFSHLFAIAGVIAVLALIVAYHRGMDPFDLPPHDRYSNTPSPEAPRPPAPREAAH